VIIRNIRIKELLRILANLQMNHEIVDILFDTLRNGIIINPVNILPPTAQEEPPKKEEHNDKIDPSASLNELLGE